jgi:predicted outer membrane protein
MGVKAGVQSSRNMRDESHRRCDRRATTIHSDSAMELSNAEQLSKQAGRILEQLVVLDEQYHDAIIQHDQSALDALSACAVVLSRLAHVRLDRSFADASASSRTKSVSVGQGSMSGCRRTA